jgi:hypothetical protein
VIIINHYMLQLGDYEPYDLTLIPEIRREKQHINQYKRRTAGFERCSDGLECASFE